MVREKYGVGLTPDQRDQMKRPLQREVRTLVASRNAVQTTINWQLNTHGARSRLHPLHPF